MKKLPAALISFLLVGSAWSALASTKQDPFYRLPLTFEENRGQADPRFEYVTRGPGYALFLSAEKVQFELKRGAELAAPYNSFAVKLLNQTETATVRALEPAVTRSHYFLGNDPARWMTNVPHYRKVSFSSVYPGVDLVFYGNPGHLEYDFVVAAGASAEQIRLEFEGVDQLSTNEDGDLVLTVGGAQVIQKRPLVYQETSAGRTEVKGSYRVVGPRQVAFQVGAYDESRPLVIDPIILYLGYLGGSSFNDTPFGIATDSQGAAYVTGGTFSADFPANNSIVSGADAYVAKISPDGTTLEWAVFFGGSGDEAGRAIAVDASGQSHICGYTESSDLPTSGTDAFEDELQGTQDAFYAFFSSDASQLLYASYLGGQTEVQGSFSGEEAQGIGVDSNGLVYVGGFTNTSDFPTAGTPYDSTGPLGQTGDFYLDTEEAFISVFDPSQTGAASLPYSTYLGSERGDDRITALAVLSPGIVVVTGTTSEVVIPAQPAALAASTPAGTVSTPFPTSADAYQSSFQGGSLSFEIPDAFLTRFNTTAMGASAIEYSTFFGTSDTDRGIDVEVLGNDAFLVGHTEASGTDFPTTNGAYQDTNSGFRAAFVARFATADDGSSGALTYSTLFGGSDSTTGDGIGVNSSGEASIVGTTTSSDLPLVDAFQETFNGNVESTDLFVAKFNSSGSSLLFSSYLGGTSEEDATGGGVVDPAGDFLIAGQSSSNDLGTAGSFNDTLTEVKGFGQDAIIAKIGEPVDLDLTVSDDPDPVSAGANVTYSIEVQNLGTIDAENATLTVDLSQSSFVSSTVVNCAEESGTVTCDLGTIAPAPPPSPSPAGNVSLVSFDLVVQVDPFFDGSSLNHTFDVTSDQPDKDLSNNSVAVSTTVEYSADLQVTKTDSADPVVEGEAFSYTVTITNNGPSGIFFFSLTDNIPAEVSFVSSDPDDTDEICFFDDPTLDCSFFDSLGPGEDTVVTINVIAGPGPVTATNSPVVTAETSDPDESNNTVDETTTILGRPDLTVDVVDSADPVVAGTNLTYQVTVMNEGSGDAEGATLDALLDPALGFVGATTPALTGLTPQGVLCTPDGNSIACDLGTIGAGASTVVSIVTAVNPGQIAGLSSDFDVATTGPEADFEDNSTTETTAVIAQTDLSILKLDSVDPVKTNGLLNYMVTVTNQGPSNATGVSVTDPLPAGVTFISSNPGCANAGGTLTCSLGSLNPGQSKQVSVNVVVGAPPGTTLSNTATVSGSQTDLNSGNNSSTQLTGVVLSANLSVELSHTPDPPLLGVPMTISASFQNLGPDPAINGNASVLLPAALAIQSVSSSFACNPIGNQVLCNFGSFVPGQASVSINAIPSKGGDFSASASITSQSTDPVPSNNSDTDMFTVADSLDVEIVKTSRFDIAASGRSFWYEVDVNNVGNGPLTDVLVTDDLPAGLQVVGVTSEDDVECTGGPTSLSCEIALLNPGETVHFILEVSVPEGLSGPFINTIEAEATGDEEPENNSSTAPAVAAMPGDANADGGVNAADVVLILLEIADGDGDDVFEAAGGTFKGNPTMDVDNDGLITLADYDALATLLFPAPSPSPAPSNQEAAKQE